MQILLCMKCQILFSRKNQKSIISLLSAESAKKVLKKFSYYSLITFGYSLEVPCWGASNEYHNICFHAEIRKISHGYPSSLELWLPAAKYNLTMKPFNKLDFNISRQYFKILPRNILMLLLLFFPEQRVWHFMQIVSSGDNSHEMSNPFFWWVACVEEENYF